MGAFDDLIPKVQTGNAFADLIPQRPTSQPSTLSDVGRGALAGLERGAIGLAGMPGDVRDLALSALPQPPAPQPAPEGLYGKVVSALEGARNALELPTSGGITKAVESATGPIYQPQTTPGKYTETAASFLPAIAGGEGSIGSRLLKMVALPAVASETAGEATAGTPIETVARAGAASAAGGIGAIKKGATPVEPPSADTLESAATKA